jgi:hypothetical protein
MPWFKRLQVLLGLVPTETLHIDNFGLKRGSRLWALSCTYEVVRVVDKGVVVTRTPHAT